jgi:hypothetical protein
MLRGVSSISHSFRFVSNFAKVSSHGCWLVSSSLQQWDAFLQDCYYAVTMAQTLRTAVLYLRGIIWLFSANYRRRNIHDKFTFLLGFLCYNLQLAWILIFQVKSKITLTFNFCNSIIPLGLLYVKIKPSTKFSAYDLRFPRRRV